jgi:hypothetical protein
MQRYIVVVLKHVRAGGIYIACVKEVLIKPYAEAKKFADRWVTKPHIDVQVFRYNEVTCKKQVLTHKEFRRFWDGKID